MAKVILFTGVGLHSLITDPDFYIVCKDRKWDYNAHGCLAGQEQCQTSISFVNVYY